MISAIPLHHCASTITTNHRTSSPTPMSALCLLPTLSALSPSLYFSPPQRLRYAISGVYIMPHAPTRLRTYIDVHIR